MAGDVDGNVILELGDAVTALQTLTGTATDKPNPDAVTGKSGQRRRFIFWGEFQTEQMNEGIISQGVTLPSVLPNKTARHPDTRHPL